MKPKAKKPTPQKTSSGDNLLSFRLDPEPLAELDRVVAKLREERPGVTITRATAARETLARALMMSARDRKP